MTLLEFHADLEQLTFQMKRIADLLEEWIKPPTHNGQVDRKQVELTVVKPRSRWEAEAEDRKWRKISEAEAAVMPRR